jgi:ABC-type antimicrobial peptide transport system permease subunit
MAMTTALVGLVVGIPLGLGAGRVVWHEVADSVGVAPAATPPWAVLGVAVPAVLVVAVAVSLLPARRAARLSPARVLRAE